MNNELRSTLISWGPFVLLMAAWYLFGRTWLWPLLGLTAKDTPGLLDNAPPKDSSAADHQPWFAAMTYHALILNRTYKVFLTDQMLVGAAVRGPVANPPIATSAMFQQEFWVQTRKAEQYARIDLTSEKLLRMDTANFQIRWNEIVQTEYRADRKWSMGKVPHSGRLLLRLRDDSQRELILLGKQNGNALKERLDRLIQASAGTVLALQP